MRTVTGLLQEKGRDVVAMRPTATVFEALEMMAEKNIGAVLVVEAGAIVGIVSERDHARKVDLLGRSSKNTAISEIMVRDVITAQPDQSLEDCMSVMTARRVRHLPVMDAGHLVGLISVGDVVKGIISSQATAIRDLEGYVSGHPASAAL